MGFNGTAPQTATFLVIATATGVADISFCIGLYGSAIETATLNVILYSLNRSVPLNATFVVIL